MARVKYYDAGSASWKYADTTAGGSGTPGKDGVSCTHEWNGTVLTVTSASGTSSADLKGEKGDAYTLTDADKNTIVQAVKGICVAKNQGAENVGKILAVGTDGNLTLVNMPEGGASGDVTGVLDESNNILLSGNLADGTYTLKYLNADGTYSDVGSIVIGEIVPEPTNFFVVDGDGYLNPGRASSNGADRTDVSQCFLTNYIEVQNGDEVYTYGACLSNTNVGNMGLYKADKTGVGFYVRTSASDPYLSNIQLSDEVDVFTINYTDVKYMRVCCLIPSDLSTIKINIKRNGEWL